MAERIVAWIGLLAIATLFALAVLALLVVLVVSFSAAREWAYEWVGEKFGFNEQIRCLRASYWRSATGSPAPKGTLEDVEHAIRWAVPAGVSVEVTNKVVPGQSRYVVKVEVSCGE
jgi:hypothetical protein